MNDGVLASLSATDAGVLRAVNRGLGGWADVLFPFITDSDNFVFAGVVAVILIAMLGRASGRWTLIAIGLAVLLSDQVASKVIKPVFERTRPCNLLGDVRLIAGYASGFSFPSSHAANTAAAALATSVRHPRLASVVVPIAVLVGMSRVYVGVHYPSDVLGGLIVGAACGATTALAVSASVKVFSRRGLRRQAVYRSAE